MENIELAIKPVVESKRENVRAGQYARSLDHPDKSPKTFVPS
jgi:hypothetical protein